MKKNNVVLVAGGTGGHINAAIALGDACKQKGFEVLYLTGERPLDYKLFSGQNAIHLKSSALRYKNPFKLLQGFLKNFITFISLLIQLYKISPKFVVGAGGYVCGPSLLAAYILRIPVYIIEQNSVMGLTNRILGVFSRKIFVHFQKTQGLKSRLLSKVVVAGNPVRNEINILDYPQRVIQNQLNILVFGGSLGAQEINILISELCQMTFEFKISIHHQTGLENKDLTSKISPNIEYKSFKYIENMGEEYQWADLVIARAGASTVGELRVVQKSSILIPYPFATDNHQEFNAIELKDEKRFDVFVHTAKELKNDNCQLLRKILTEVFGKLKNPSPWHSNRDKSTEIVISEILKNVQ